MTMRRRQSAIAAASVLALIPFTAQSVYLPYTETTTLLDGSKTEDQRRLSNSRNHVRGQRRLQGEDDEVKWGSGYHVYDDIMKDSDIPIIKFPFARGRDEMGQGVGENTHESGEMIDSTFPECQSIRLDFSKAADGRPLPGGSFVGDEWYKEDGVKISSYSHEGKKHDVHPMIFDSTDIVSNGLDRADMYFLGSPNFECGGFGVGNGGRVGQDGENCQRLGNLLIPSRIPGTPTKKKDDDLQDGGVLVFDFYKKTEIQHIAFLNIMEGDGSEMEIIHNDGTSETIELSSVGKNGYQVISLAEDNVERLSVSLKSFAGVASINLCVELDLDQS
jgi:hypothetical protein